MTKIVYLCINLERATERKSHMQQQAQQAGIDLEFIEAIDGQKLDISNVSEYARAERLLYAPDLQKNEVACALSHKKAIEAFLYRDANAVVILEDDTILAPHFKAFVQAVVNLPVSWDAVSLHNRKGRIINSSLINPVAGSGLYASGWVSYGAEAWLFSRRGAELALKSLNSFRHGYDTHLGFFWRHGIAPLCAYPPVVTLASMPSTITVVGEKRTLIQNDLTTMQYLRTRKERIQHEVVKEITARFIRIKMKRRLSRAGYSLQFQN